MNASDSARTARTELLAPMRASQQAPALNLQRPGRPGGHIGPRCARTPEIPRPGRGTGSEPHRSGRPASASGQPSDETGSNWPWWLRSPGWTHTRIAIAGAHGGAGTTTLAAWLAPDARDLGVLRPAAYRWFPASATTGLPLVVTCHPTVPAARAATAVIAALRKAGGHVTVLAVISDGWPEPAAAAHRFRLLTAQVDAIVRVPFVLGLRLADDVAAVPLSRSARHAIRQIRAAAGLSSRIP